jgi:hypothetical protein
MPKRANYVDGLRDILLALAIVPIAGLHAASYWLRESLERTARLATDAMATTSLARSALLKGARNKPVDDPTADVLAHDLLEAARTYVRGMVRLPADSGIYFTEELERRLNALLLKIQPDAQTDLDSYVDVELERLLSELDRLYLVARAEAGRAGRRGLTSKEQARRRLVRRLDGLRTQTKRVRAGLSPTPADKISLEAPRRGRLRALEVYRARTKVEQALRDAHLVPDRKAALLRLRTGIERLTYETVPGVEAPAKGVQSNGESKR